MKTNLLPFLMIILMSFSCEPGDRIIVKCDYSASIIGRDTSAWICGGHFLMVSEDKLDTLHIQYNAVLRDFFQVNEYSNEDFPIPVFIEYTDLPEGDDCAEHLKELICIGNR